jgi:hypothetical protein
MFFCSICGSDTTVIMKNYWLRHYATSRKVVGSRPDEANEFFQFTQSFQPWGLLSLQQKWVPEAEK